LKAKKTYLKGKSVFIVSILVVGVTLLLVYLTGKPDHRTITSNAYLSLSIIGGVLFIFMTYGLFKGIGLIDNFPKFKNFKSENTVSDSGMIPNVPDMPDIEIDGLGELLLAILFWIVMTAVVIVLLLFLEAFFWYVLFVFLAMLYWVFFRALRLVFSKSSKTKGNIGISTVYSLIYTTLYLSWMYGIVYFTEMIR